METGWNNDLQLKIHGADSLERSVLLTRVLGLDFRHCHVQGAMHAVAEKFVTIIFGGQHHQLLSYQWLMSTGNSMVPICLMRMSSS